MGTVSTKTAHQRKLGEWGGGTLAPVLIGHLCFEGINEKRKNQFLHSSLPSPAISPHLLSGQFQRSAWELAVQSLSSRFLPWNPTDNTDEHADSPGREAQEGARADCRVWFRCWEMPGFIEHSLFPIPVTLEFLPALSSRKASISSALTPQHPSHHALMGSLQPRSPDYS